MTTELRTMDNQALALPDESTLKGQLQAINRFQQVVHRELIAEVDYGVIPGTGSKPTLLKPGAEKITKLLGLSDEYIIVSQVEDWQKGFFRYLIKCTLRSISNGILISEGMGECNSMESKYRWRESKRKCLVCGAEAIIKGKEEYGGGWICFKKQGGCGAKFGDDATEITSQKVGKVENDDIYSQVNTILKMGKKRALVDAALSAGRLSNVFTQDLEDMPVAAPVNAKPVTQEQAFDQMGQDAPSQKRNTDPDLLAKMKALTGENNWQAFRQTCLDKGKTDPEHCTPSTAHDYIDVLEKRQKAKAVK